MTVTGSSLSGVDRAFAFLLEVEIHGTLRLAFCCHVSSVCFFILFMGMFHEYVLFAYM